MKLLVYAMAALAALGALMLVRAHMAQGTGSVLKEVQAQPNPKVAPEPFVARLAKKAAAPSQSSQRTRTATPPLAPSAMPTTEVVAEDPDLVLADTHAQYEVTFSSEPADPEWAAREKVLTEEKLRALLPKGSTLRSFECRTTLCRLETSHSDRESYVEFARAAFMSPEGLSTSGAYSLPENGDPDAKMMVSYLAPAGKDFPRFNQ